VAKAYRLLRAILNTAADDGLIRRNPCRIKGAGQEKSPERPVLTISDAGKRTVAVPDLVMPDLVLYIMTHAAPGDDGLLFTSPASGPLRHSNFYRRAWMPALRTAELPAIHFHDLRHTGNTLAADTGATLRELMDRMGHSTARAAMIYLHGSDERQQAIANALSRRATEELGRPQPSRSGTQRARKRRRAS
jgi:integrase